MVNEDDNGGREYEKEKVYVVEICSVGVFKETVLFL